MIELPLPGSTDVPAMLAPQEPSTPLKVWLPRELVAELVRHVVDGEQVADRGR